MTNYLNTVDRICPPVDALDADWSAQTLNQITSAVTRRRRNRLAVAAFGTTATLLVGGGAYAGGLVPAFVTEGLGQVTDQTVTNVDLIADMTLPDGRRVAVWTAQNENGENCRAIADDWNGENESLGSSFECGSNFPAVDYLWTSGGYVDGSEPTPAYLVVFGTSPTTGATSANVSGNGFDVRVPIDSTTEGFGASIPIAPRLLGASTADTSVRVDFLDEQGRRIDSVTLADR